MLASICSPSETTTASASWRPRARSVSWSVQLASIAWVDESRTSWTRLPVPVDRDDLVPALVEAPDDGGPELPEADDGVASHGDSRSYPTMTFSSA